LKEVVKVKYSKRILKAILENVTDKTLPVPNIDENFLSIHTKKLYEEKLIKGKSVGSTNFEDPIDLKTFKITTEGTAFLQKLNKKDSGIKDPEGN
jgi:hypothetical protein